MDEMHAASPSRSTSPWRKTVTAFSVTVLSALVAVAGCVERSDPVETFDSLRLKSPTLQDKATLRIGVRSDVPFVAYKNDQGELAGFEIDLAKAIAEELGYTAQRIEWVVVDTMPERWSALQLGLADMTLASISITEQREAWVDFAGPYQLVPQRVMVPANRAEEFTTISDLGKPDVRVCVGTASTSEKALAAKGIRPDPVDSAQQCLDGLKAGSYQAYSTDLPILAGFLAQNPDQFKILNIEIADGYEHIGVAVPNGDWAMRDLVAYILDRWQRSSPSPWLDAYNRHLRTLPEMGTKYATQPRVNDPPILADYDSKAQPR